MSLKAVPLLPDFILQRRSIAYAYDLQTFFRFLTEKNTMLKNTAIKDITIDFLENLTFEDINEYQRYLRFNNDDGSTHQNQDKGIARRMAALRGFFEFACTHQYMKNNPTVVVVFPSPAGVGLIAVTRISFPSFLSDFFKKL